jgi:hypothetical protein
MPLLAKAHNRLYCCYIVSSMLPGGRITLAYLPLTATWAQLAVALTLEAMVSA